MTSLLLHNLSCNNNSIKQCKLKKEELIVWFLLNNSFQCVFQCACMYSSQDIVLQSISVCVLESSTSSVLVWVFVCTVCLNYLTTCLPDGQDWGLMFSWFVNQVRSGSYGWPHRIHNLGIARHLSIRFTGFRLSDSSSVHKKTNLHKVQNNQCVF